MASRPPAIEYKNKEVDIIRSAKEMEDDPDDLQPQKSNKLTLIIVLIVLLAGGLGYVMFFAPSKVTSSLRALGPKEAGPGEKILEKEEASVAQGHLYNMDPFVVNLADTDRSRFLKIRINIESQEGKPNEEFDKRLPQLRDTILTVLTSKTAKDIFDSEGKRKLREEIIRKLNQTLTRFKVKTIYFTEFMIQ
jgi:flagellar protein FliL